MEIREREVKGREIKRERVKGRLRARERVKEKETSLIPRKIDKKYHNKQFCKYCRACNFFAI